MERHVLNTALKLPYQRFNAHIDHNGVMRNENILSRLAAILRRELRGVLSV
jgi:hypothetical protein